MLNYRSASLSIIALLCTLMLVVIFEGCGSPRSTDREILVFAAASLADALRETESAFEADSDVEVVTSYGASQMLAQQIASGAPSDIIITAGKFPIEFLTTRGLIEPEVSALLTNRLVVAVQLAAPNDISSLKYLESDQVERVALADLKLAPAGRYAQKALIYLDIWDAIQPKLVFGPDVRAALAYLESGNADAALLYATDANASDSVRVLDIIPVESYPRIVYPAAIVTNSARKKASREYMDFLTGEEASQIFHRHGFEPAH